MPKLNTIIKCKFCNNGFVVTANVQKYCPKCRELPHSIIYDYKVYHRKANKLYRKVHKEAWQDDRDRTKIRHNEETLTTATNRYKTWTKDEIKYLKEFAKTKTARQLAKDLNRTYIAVISKCYNEHIVMMTDDKRHNRLKTE